MAWGERAAPDLRATGNRKSMARILIVDNQPIISAGLKAVLKDTPGLALVSEARSANNALQEIGKAKIDVVITEISLPGRDGLDLLREIKHDRPQLPVLIYTMYSEEEYGVRALRAGAMGFVTKFSQLDEVVVAIRKVSSGRKYISQGLAAMLACRLQNSDNRAPHELLSDREHQVMRKIVSGESLKAIARDLCVSPKTVSTYRSRLLEKMQMTTNAELIRYSVEPAIPIPIAKADPAEKTPQKSTAVTPQSALSLIRSRRTRDARK